VSVRVKMLSGLHRGVLRASGGRVGGRIVGMPVLLLTTRGRRSGRPRTVPLTYIRDGGALILVASYGGRPRNPDWFENLVVHPEVDVDLDGERCARRARPAGADERARLWPLVVEAYRGYAAYQAKTSREIPLAILESRIADG
jgi:deazaflavin-dependent oxidoreductase (nitroreductase family)